MPGLAQVGATTADLSGVVVDQLRAVVPGVAVRAANDATGLERNAVTGADGRYVIPALPPGIYSVTAALAGSATQRAENIRLALGEAMVLGFELEIAARPEAITVVAEPVLGAMRQASVATVVSQGKIESLPTNGRNFIAFSLITPGVNGDRTPQQGASASSGLTFVGQQSGTPGRRASRRARRPKHRLLANPEPRAGDYSNVMSIRCRSRVPVNTGDIGVPFGW